MAERVVAVDEALAHVPHAFGGALALAYYAEPRGTIDIDVNVFVPPSNAASVLGPLGEMGADVGAPGVEELVRRDGQVRVMWERTPIDLFFAYDDFHDAAARARRLVPFGDRTIPVLSAEHLVVCKSIFDRSRDWVDIDAILDGGMALDTAEVLRWVGRIAGDEDPRYARIAAVLTRPPA
jgi:hypothetical protein